MTKNFPKKIFLIFPVKKILLKTSFFAVLRRYKPLIRKKNFFWKKCWNIFSRKRNFFSKKNFFSQPWSPGHDDAVPRPPLLQAHLQVPTNFYLVIMNWGIVLAVFRRNSCIIAEQGGLLPIQGRRRPVQQVVAHDHAHQSGDLSIFWCRFWIGNFTQFSSRT